jgi:hypothetical protein
MPRLYIYDGAPWTETESTAIEHGSSIKEATESLRDRRQVSQFEFSISAVGML